MLLDKQTSDLRYHIMASEVQEYKEAVESGDIRKIADALGDILFGTIGTALAHGLDIEKIFDAIHESNMTKERPDKTGKAIKGKDYKEPNLRFIQPITKGIHNPVKGLPLTLFSITEGGGPYG